MFNAPHSRHSQIVREDVEKNPELTILADSEEARSIHHHSKEGRQIFVTGHPEYDVLTLDGEYKRDLAKEWIMFHFQIATTKTINQNSDR